MASLYYTIKIWMDSRSKKVLFAEAGKDFVDFLFYIMSLPVGSLINLIRKLGEVGCLSNLYESIENLNESYMQPNQEKGMFLKPRPSVPEANFPLLLSVSLSTELKLYCSSEDCNCVTDVRGTACFCGNSLSDKCEFVAGNAAAAAAADWRSGGGFVKGDFTYMVADDLTVQPISSISSITLLKKHNINDIGCVEEKVVNFGMDKVTKLLRASLRSREVLTEVFK